MGVKEQASQSAALPPSCPICTDILLSSPRLCAKIHFEIFSLPVENFGKL
jgi:hypothetical protein